MRKKNKIIEPTIPLHIFTEGYIMIEDAWIREEDTLVDRFGNEYTIIDYKVILDQVVIEHNATAEELGLDYVYPTPPTIINVKRLGLKLNKEVINCEFLMVK